MFKRILVPLDGSRLAETVLLTGNYLSQHCDARLLFFTVIEKGGSASIHGERHLSNIDEAQEYLKQLAARQENPQNIEIHVHETEQEHVPRSIIAHAEELKCDLILLCAHGSGGLRDFFIGSIAQQVIQRGNTPVFFLRPEFLPEDGTFTGIKKILVPLDGTDLHTSTLHLAIQIAFKCSALLRFVTVVPTVSTLPADAAQTGLFLPATMTAVLDLAQRGAKDSLIDAVNTALEKGVNASGVVRRGDAALEILKEAERADLIIMSTHARVNWDAFWEESVTPKVMVRSHSAMLLIRSPR